MLMERAAALPPRRMQISLRGQLPRTHTNGRPLQYETAKSPTDDRPASLRLSQSGLGGEELALDPGFGRFRVLFFMCLEKKTMEK